MEEENRRILEFAHVQQEREAERMALKKAKEASMDKVQQAVCITWLHQLIICRVLNKSNRFFK